jgi:hypothetical protein
MNVMPLCTADAAVIIDDLTPRLKWGEGPARAWNDAISDGLVRQDDVFNDGQQVSVIEPPGERVWALGRHLF